MFGNLSLWPSVFKTCTTISGRGEKLAPVKKFFKVATNFWYHANACFDFAGCRKTSNDLTFSDFNEVPHGQMFVGIAAVGFVSLARPKVVCWSSKLLNKKSDTALSASSDTADTPSKVCRCKYSTKWGRKNEFTPASYDTDRILFADSEVKSSFEFKTLMSISVVAPFPHEYSTYWLARLRLPHMFDSWVPNSDLFDRNNKKRTLM